MKRIILIVLFIASVLSAFAVEFWTKYRIDGIYYWLTYHNGKGVAQVTHGDTLCSSVFKIIDVLPDGSLKEIYPGASAGKASEAAKIQDEDITSLSPGSYRKFPENAISAKRHIDHYSPGQTIVDNSYYSGDIVVPDYVVFRDTAYSVYSLDYGAFYKCKDLTSLTLPNSIEEIGGDCFYLCENLTTMNVPASLKSIGHHFAYGSGLKELNLPDSIVSLCEGFSSDIILNFSDNIAKPERGYAPFFYSYSGLNLKSSSCPAPEVYQFPKSCFFLDEKAILRGPEILVFPDIESFASNHKGISYRPKYIVCLGSTPPIIEEFNPWYWLTPLDIGIADSDKYLPDLEGYKKIYGPEGLLADYTGVTLVVPEGSEEFYRTARIWSNFENILGVKSFDRFLDGTAATSLTLDDNATPDIAITPDGITVFANAETTVTVTTITGVQIISRNISGTASIPLPPGLYIVKAGSSVKKIKI